MGNVERYGVEWGRGMVKLMVFQDHQMATPPEFHSHVVPILWPLAKAIKRAGYQVMWMCLLQSSIQILLEE